jgi:hypothetical protein
VKPVLNWIKKNLVIVISAVLILVFLPAGWFFSSGWNKKVRTQATEAYSTTRGELQRVGSVTYALPAVLAGEESVSDSRAPNRVVTEFFKQQGDVRLAQVRDVVERGTAFNRRNHRELVPGLLPAAPNNSVLRRLGLEMAEQIAGTRDASGNVVRASVYDQLLRRLNAGAPPMPEELGSILAEYANREQERYASGSTDNRLTEAQTQQMAQDMVKRRLQEYAGRAKSLAFYATLESIRGPEGAQQMQEPGWSRIPTTPPSQSEITEADAFVWLWDYWIVTDVLEAVALANTDRVSGAMPIPDAPVKRVERLRISEVNVPPVGGAATDDMGAFGSGFPGGGDRDSRDSFGGASMGGDPAAGPAPSVTHTGRATDAAYDLRTVQLQVIASSQDLPRLFDALGRVNYMTVVGVRLEPVDVWAQLDEGFFYGDEHVVRAIIDIETIWLRSWTLPLMPERVRLAVGAPVEPPAVDESGDGSEEFQP